MSKILVCRTGSTWHGESASFSTLTSQRNHDAVVSTLLLAGHEVLQVGRLSGELLNTGRGARQLSWKAGPGVLDHSEIVRDIAAWKPEVWLECCGAAPTNVDPENERGSIVQAATWRYWYPAFKLLEALRLPRICVVTDCRCYPREQEINWYDWWRPAAILSQEETTIERRILDKQWAICAKYAAIERLRLRGIEPMPVRCDALGCVAVAHAHAQDKRISRGRREVWTEIGRSTRKVAVYGEGWEWHDCDDALEINEFLSHENIWPTLNGASCGPLVPMRHGWISPKYGEYALAGCVPLPHGRGGSLTYDASGLVVPLSHETRFESADELGALVELADRDYDWRCDRIYEARERFEIDDRVLLACVEHFARRRGVDIERFGGMTHD